MTVILVASYFFQLLSSKAILGLLGSFYSSTSNENGPKLSEKGLVITLRKTCLCKGEIFVERKVVSLQF